MNCAQLGRRNSLAHGLLGSLLLGLGLGVAARAGAAEQYETAPAVIFAAQMLPARDSRLVAVSPEPELRPIPAADSAPVPVPARPTVSSSPLPDLDAGELFPAEAFADAADQPSCSTVASLAEGLLGTCLRRGLNSPEQQLTQRLLFSAAQPNRTDAWSRDTESLFRLAQCAGSVADQRLVAGAALAAADTELEVATPAQPAPEQAAPALSESRRDRAQRAQWLWTYRLATLDVTQGSYLRASATLFRLHRTAPTRNLVSRITAARQLLLQLHVNEVR